MSQLNKLDYRIMLINSQLIKWSFEYYRENSPSHSDLEYDAVYHTYLDLLKKTTYRPFCDMSKKVGAVSLRAYHTAGIQLCNYFDGGGSVAKLLDLSNLSKEATR